VQNRFIKTLLFFRIPNYGIGIPISQFFNSGIQEKFSFSESKMESEFCFRWGSQKSDPKIEIPNQVSDAFLENCPIWFGWARDMGP
jgi:hypothetical protein